MFMLARSRPVHDPYMLKQMALNVKLILNLAIKSGKQKKTSKIIMIGHCTKTYAIPNLIQS